MSSTWNAEPDGMLEVTLVLVLSLILSVVLLVWIGSWYARRKMHELQRELKSRVDQDRRRGEAYDIGTPPGEDPAPRLGDGR